MPLYLVINPPSAFSIEMSRSRRDLAAGEDYNPDDLSADCDRQQFNGGPLFDRLGADQFLISLRLEKSRGL